MSSNDTSHTKVEIKAISIDVAHDKTIVYFMLLSSMGDYQFSGSMGGVHGFPNGGVMDGALQFPYAPKADGNVTGISICAETRVPPDSTYCGTIFIKY
ncbi:hypothetical protein EPA93_04130 [Ktedonosporobacter rubrisoli]|uniref:Uncharacterized protein n=1 Tax=Ktedonosporobacter rubrisoli TaxID=2509675 RepID=A0A4P6JJE0_KTERU|nr:hypothetical protein [Ktedonosporobacter rubrisoli]QBD75225.1 hypothetical protein EPA93_04130 [Ktedonosporobacter rubrisoli]